MTIRTPPMASGAMTPAAPGMTVQPTVRTRKKVPINSASQARGVFMEESNQIRFSVTIIVVAAALWAACTSRRDVATLSAASVFGIAFTQLLNDFVSYGGHAGLLVGGRRFL